MGKKKPQKINFLQDLENNTYEIKSVFSTLNLDYYIEIYLFIYSVFSVFVSVS